MIIEATVPNVPANTPFTVNGTLKDYVTAPTLVYSDSPVLSVPAPTGVVADATGTSVTVKFPAVTPTITAPSWQPLPAGAVISSTAFTFQHPGLPVGAQALGIADNANKAVACYVSYTATVAESPNGTIVSPPTFITGSDGTKWSLTPGLQVTANGVIDTGTANAVELYYHLADHRVYHKNTGGNWYWKVKPTDTAWVYTATAPG